MLDDIDRKILEELTKNGRQSMRELANKLGVSAGTVAKHVKKLERSGIITGYTVVINHEKLGYDLTAVIELSISKGRLLEVERLVSAKKNVCAVYDVTGTSDAIVVAKFKNRKELSDFIKNLLSHEHVESTITHVVLNTVKEKFNWV